MAPSEINGLWNFGMAKELTPNQGVTLKWPQLTGMIRGEMTIPWTGVSNAWTWFNNTL